MSTTIPIDATIIVNPFAVAVDTREQAPYGFQDLPVRARDRGKRLVVPCEYLGLGQGDYSIVGHAMNLGVERKSLEDLYSTLGQGRDRFERELDRLNSLSRAEVVVEATLEMVCRPKLFRPAWRSKMDSRSVWGQIFKWKEVFQKVGWTFAGNRRMGEIATFEILERFWRERQREEKAKAEAKAE